MITRDGSCRCGSVQFSVKGEPDRIGICHCTDCRQESGSAFTYFGVWPASSFQCSGLTAMYEGRQFCLECGSRLFATDEREAEIKLGSLRDAPTGLTPTYELWVKRRENWLRALPNAEQYKENRPS